MAVKPMDALGSFVYLLDNVENWSTTIQTLSTHVEQKHTEFVAEYARLLKHARPRRVKSPSITSIQSRDKIVASPTPVDTSSDALSPAPDPIEIDPFEAGNRYLFAQAQKKRRPDSLVRSGASGPQKFRSKNQVVIYYDSHVQGELDRIFKAVVVARNNLRKGKNALASTNGFLLPGLRQRVETGCVRRPEAGPKDVTPSQASTSAFAGTKPRVPEIAEPAVNDHELAITQTDKNLEAIQSLCETAAHQFLRDGDCQAELESVLTRFHVVLAQARLSADVLRKEEAAKDCPAFSSSDISLSSNDQNSHTGSESTLCTKPSMEAHQLLVAKMVPMVDTLSKQQAPIMASIVADPVSSNLEIEIDDGSDESDYELDLDRFRAYTTRGLRAA